MEGEVPGGGRKGQGAKSPLCSGCFPGSVKRGPTWSGGGGVDLIRERERKSGRREGVEREEKERGGRREGGEREKDEEEVWH